MSRAIQYSCRLGRRSRAYRHGEEQRIVTRMHWILSQTLLAYSISFDIQRIVVVRCKRAVGEPCDKSLSRFLRYYLQWFKPLRALKQSLSNTFFITAIFARVFNPQYFQSHPKTSSVDPQGAMRQFGVKHAISDIYGHCMTHPPRSTTALLVYTNSHDVPSLAEASVSLLHTALCLVSAIN